MNQAVPMPSIPATAAAWRVALPALALTFLLVLVLFRETATAMASIWVRSDTYAHGLIVPPLTLWLIWRKRASLALLAPTHTYGALLLLAGAGFAWLLGELAAVNALSQFALVFILIFIVPVVLGWRVARCIAFPLCFLLFAVPFGDFTQPKLMEWTAHFTVLGLRLTGIPVYSEGQHLIIPTGSWSVVEACSGVRYLIASVTVGTLFAYLTYHSLARRLTFVAISILVPIVANWGRAYMIVMLGHLSGNKLAVGVDHLIYGWVFFGIVIMAMFWIGARWREDDPPQPRPQPSRVLPTAAVTAGAASVWVAAVASVLVASLWPFAEQQLAHSTGGSLSRMASLGAIDGWQPTPSALKDWRPRFGDYAASTQETFENGGQLAGLFLAYYRNQDQQHKMVSSMNVLVTNDDPVWAKVAGGTREISFNQQALPVSTTQLRGPGGTRLVVWQWYWVNGQWTSSDALVKVYTALSRLTGKGDDSAVIVLYAPQGQAGEGDAVLADFARAAGPAVSSALQQTLATR
jgi:exosortase A